MKKIYALAVAAFLCGKVSAQVSSSGFEGFGLSAESFYNGSDGAGDLSVEFLNFTNYYDMSWGSWNGFSVSNMTDVVTPGWGNQYSAFTGSGRNSAHYGVFYPTGNITPGNTQYPEAVIIDSLWITNTTYAAISMRDGDAFSKQFGSVNGPDGLPDGTNGEDFFKVWVIGFDNTGSYKDSVEVFLADYRFSDNSFDYILSDWLKVDLSTFSFNVNRVEFRLESSDNGAWGMNTPAYFAIDDVYHHFPLAVNELDGTEISVFPNPMQDEICVKGAEGELSLLDVNGAVILKQTHAEFSKLDVSWLPKGVYILQIESNGQKAVKKLVK